MTSTDLLARYNYEEFVPAKFEPWLRFDESLPLGGPAPDFPLWHLDGKKTSLICGVCASWKQNRLHTRVLPHIYDCAQGPQPAR